MYLLTKLLQNILDAPSKELNLSFSIRKDYILNKATNYFGDFGPKWD
jgi:hypothetical protein